MRIIAGLLLAIIIVTASAAELLVTANPFGKGRVFVEGAYISDSNVSNVSGYSATTTGAYLGYGYNEKLDIIVSAGSANVGGLPAGLSSTTSGLGLNAKYALIEEGLASPVSVALGAGYKLISNVATLTGTTGGNQLLLALGVSKIMAPFVPYAGLDYRSVSYNAANTQNQVDLTIGTAIAWSMQGAVLIEYTMQSITPTSVTANYSSGQIAAGVAYKM